MRKEFVVMRELLEQAGIVRYNGGYDDGQGICIHF